ncbi:hypothetical protein IFM89_018296 [Coptis chinensis]|uniref:Ubiquitin-like domain-containing protein n=1 Tax=Coptis chinensis TaxID=261450 RepID=A0A835GX46_9MAGN|nr:hypothetical protein IFM89_018296 [Coptis chinensis]
MERRRLKMARTKLIVLDVQPAIANLHSPFSKGFFSTCWQLTTVPLYAQREGVLKCFSRKLRCHNTWAQPTTRSPNTPITSLGDLQIIDQGLLLDQRLLIQHFGQLEDCRDRDKAGISSEERGVIITGKLLEDRRALATVYLVLSFHGGMLIFVNSLAGKTITWEVESSYTTYNEKTKIQGKEGISDQEMGVYICKHLKDWRTFACYNIQTGIQPDQNRITFARKQFNDGRKLVCRLCAVALFMFLLCLLVFGLQKLYWLFKAQVLTLCWLFKAQVLTL